MELRRLGRTDLQVSCLCLGTMMYGDQISEAVAQAQMDASLDRGITFFDTAELYTIPPKPRTQGESERIVGRWMADRGVRDKIILATKVVGRSGHMNWLRADGRLPRVVRADIEEAIDVSLKNLQTDYIDLYQIHWPDRQVPIFGEDIKGFRHNADDNFAAFEDTLQVMDDLQKAGKIRHFGLSNETPYGVMRFLAESDNRGLPRVQSIQNVYNLLSRYFEYGLAEVAMYEDVGLLAYSPLAQGVISGKYLDGAKPKGSRGEIFGRLGRYETPSAEVALRGYLEVAKQFGVDPIQLAMQFVTTRPWVTSNIFGASTMEQFEVCVGSLDMAWTDELEKAVNAVHATWPNPCP